MKLYYAPNTCALAVHIALLEAGIDFELSLIDFGSNQQRSRQFLNINPKGRVPALVEECGVLTETPAILAYIARIRPEARLAPLHDAFALANMESFNCYLCSTVHVAHAHWLRGHRWSDDPNAIASMRKMAPQTIVQCFEMMEHELFVGPWARGDDYSISDPYLFTVARWLAIMDLNVNDYPRISAHFHRMKKRAAVQQALKYHRLEFGVLQSRD